MSENIIFYDKSKKPLISGGYYLDSVAMKNGEIENLFCRVEFESNNAVTLWYDQGKIITATGRLAQDEASRLVLNC